MHACMRMRVCMHACKYSCMHACIHVWMHPEMRVWTHACLYTYACIQIKWASSEHQTEVLRQSSSHHMPMSHHAWCSGAVFESTPLLPTVLKILKEIQGLKALKCKNFTRLLSCHEFHCSNDGQSQSKFIHTKRQIYTNLMILRSKECLNPWALIAQSQTNTPSPMRLEHVTSWLEICHPNCFQWS